MVDGEEAEPQSGRPEIRVAPANITDLDDRSVARIASIPPVIFHPPGNRLGDHAATLPEGLTVDGEKEFRRLVAAELETFTRHFKRELMLYWESLKLDGPECLTWDRVQAAHAALQETKRREIMEAARSRMRTERAAELQQAKDQLTAQTKLAGRRWAGSALINASGATIAVLAVPDGSIWIIESVPSSHPIEVARRAHA